MVKKSIPIQNIYYLLCYAWDRLEERDIVQVDPMEHTNLANLFAKILINGMHHLRKRGIDRGYLETGEETQTIRGKLDFSYSLKRNLFSQAKAYCTYDILSYDILHNQIIKATLLRLSQLSSLESSFKDQLRDIVAWFPDVTMITITSNHFRRVQINRNNSFYEFLLNICELIQENLLVSENSGETYFRDFTRNEQKMSLLFEHFVRNFYKRELHNAKVDREKIKWVAVPFQDSSLQYLPTMETDISIQSDDRKIIIDTKFTPNLFSQHYISEKETFRSDHLYQLFSYLKNIESKSFVNETCDGVLLYPSVDHAIQQSYQMGNHTVSIRTINLNQKWENIHMNLFSLIVDVLNLNFDDNVLA